MTPATPCVFISVPNGASAGTVLRPGLLGRLLEAHPGVEIVLFSPLVKDPAFVREFSGPRVRLEYLPPHVPAGLESRLVALMQASYLTSNASESVRIRFAEARRKRSIRWLRTKRALTQLLAPSMGRPGTRYDLSDRLIAHAWADEMFDRYRPSLLVASSPGLLTAEIPLLRTAARRGVRSVAIDASWDNFTNKLIPVRRVDRLVVWNGLMKEQAVAMHGYDADDIRVSGPAHWDRYFREPPSVDRDAFFHRIGADPSRALVTLTTMPQSISEHQPHAVRALARAVQTGAWPVPAQLLVRLHPRDVFEPYAEFQGLEHVIIEKPFRPTVKTVDGLDIDITAESQQHLAETLRYSDVVINIASTIAIEASIFDTPVVNISFDGAEPSVYEKSTRRYYRFTHYVNITRHHAVRVAETPEQMVDQVGQYLSDRSIDREGRGRVVLDQCVFTDGRSAERVAQYVADELAEVVGAPSPAPCVESLASSR